MLHNKDVLLSFSAIKYTRRAHNILITNKMDFDVQDVH